MVFNCFASCSFAEGSEMLCKIASLANPLIRTGHRLYHNISEPSQKPLSGQIHPHKIQTSQDFVRENFTVPPLCPTMLNRIVSACSVIAEPHARRVIVLSPTPPKELPGICSRAAAVKLTCAGRWLRRANTFRSQLTEVSALYLRFVCATQPRVDCCPRVVPLTAFIR